MKTADGRDILLNHIYYAVQDGQTVVEVKGREVGEVLGDEEFWCSDVYYVRMNAVNAEILKHEAQMQELNRRALEHANKIVRLKQDDSIIETLRK